MTLSPWPLGAAWPHTETGLNNRKRLPKAPHESRLAQNRTRKPPSIQPPAFHSAEGPPLPAPRLLSFPVPGEGTATCLGNGWWSPARGEPLFLELLGKLLQQAASCPLGPGSEVEVGHPCLPELWGLLIWDTGLWDGGASRTEQDGRTLGGARENPLFLYCLQATALPSGRPHVGLK